jgi:DNA-binding IclR family transcriptional regulator
MMRSVQRILAIFESFSESKTTLTLQEIADSSGLSKSTAFRLVQSLDKAGYLVRLENQSYCLSRRLTRLAGFVNSTLGVRQISRPYMMELSESSKESVTLHTLEGNFRVCMDVIDVPSALMSVSRPGMRVSLTEGGASSKVLMAYLSKKERQKVIAHVAKKSTHKIAKITAELDSILEQGYGVSYDERVLGIAAISAPIRSQNGEVDYSLTITAPTVRARPMEAAFIKLVKKAAYDISTHLGSDLPPGHFNSDDS